MKTYRDLIVWQKSMVLVTEVYEISRKFPKDELYGLTSQIRRCEILASDKFGKHLGENGEIQSSYEDMVKERREWNKRGEGENAKRIIRGVQI